MEIANPCGPLGGMERTPGGWDKRLVSLVREGGGRGLEASFVLVARKET